MAMMVVRSDPAEESVATAGSAGEEAREGGGEGVYLIPAAGMVDGGGNGWGGGGSSRVGLGGGNPRGGRGGEGGAESGVHIHEHAPSDALSYAGSLLLYFKKRNVRVHEEADVSCFLNSLVFCLFLVCLFLCVFGFVCQWGGTPV